MEMVDGEPSVARLWVVVPAFNESEVIGAALRGLAPWFPNVVVVDDGSSDDTGTLALASGAVVLRHAVNLGAGAATQTGIDYALRHGATHICTFDADGQHDPSTIGVMLAALEDSGAQVALGSRFLGSTIDMPPLRRLVINLAVHYTRWTTGSYFSDTHNGLRMLTAAAARACRITQPGMAHGSELLATIVREKMAYIEVPTTVTYSKYSLAKGQKLDNSVKILFDLLYAAWSR
jgi:glycosyltransferase involved in cell wall biosynthesis